MNRLKVQREEKEKDSRFIQKTCVPTAPVTVSLYEVCNVSDLIRQQRRPVPHPE